VAIFVKISPFFAEILRFLDVLIWQRSAILDLIGVHVDHPR